MFDNYSCSNINFLWFLDINIQCGDFHNIHCVYFITHENLVFTLLLLKKNYLSIIYLWLLLYDLKETSFLAFSCHPVSDLPVHRLISFKILSHYLGKCFSACCISPRFIFGQRHILLRQTLCRLHFIANTVKWSRFIAVDIK